MYVHKIINPTSETNTYYLERNELYIRQGIPMLSRVGIFHVSERVDLQKGERMLRT